YIDRVSKKLTRGVTTGQIYWGSVPFVLIQILMVGLVIGFPQMVLVYKSGVAKYDINKIQIIVPEEAPAFPEGAKGGGQAPAAPGEQQDAEKALERAFGGGGNEPAPKDQTQSPAQPQAAPPDGDDQKVLERALDEQMKGTEPKPK